MRDCWRVFLPGWLWAGAETASPAAWLAETASPVAWLAETASPAAWLAETASPVARFAETTSPAARLGEARRYSLSPVGDGALRPECLPAQCVFEEGDTETASRCLAAGGPFCVYGLSLLMDAEAVPAATPDLGCGGSAACASDDGMFTLTTGLCKYGSVRVESLRGKVTLHFQAEVFRECLVYGTSLEADCSGDEDRVLLAVVPPGAMSLELDLAELAAEGPVMRVWTNFHNGFCGGGALSVDYHDVEVAFRLRLGGSELPPVSAQNSTFLYYLPQTDSPTDCSRSQCALGPLSFAQIAACSEALPEYCHMRGQYIVLQAQTDGGCQDQRGPTSTARVSIPLDVLHIFGETISVSMTKAPVVHMKTAASRDCRIHIFAADSCPISTNVWYNPINEVLTQDNRSFELPLDRIPVVGHLSFMFDGSLDTCGHGISAVELQEAIVDFRFSHENMTRPVLPQNANAIFVWSVICHLGVLVFFCYL